MNIHTAGDLAEWDQAEAEVRHKVADRTLRVDGVFQPDTAPVLGAVLVHPDSCIHQQVDFIETYLAGLLAAHPEDFDE